MDSTAGDFDGDLLMLCPFSFVAEMLLVHRMFRNWMLRNSVQTGQKQVRDMPVGHLPQSPGSPFPAISAIHMIRPPMAGGIG